MSDWRSEWTDTDSRTYSPSDKYRRQTALYKEYKEIKNDRKLEEEVKMKKKCSFCGKILGNHRRIKLRAYSLLYVCNNCFDIWKFMLEEFKAGKQMAVRKIYSKIGDNFTDINKKGIKITKVIVKK